MAGIASVATKKNRGLFGMLAKGKGRGIVQEASKARKARGIVQEAKSAKVKKLPSKKGIITQGKI